MVIDIGLGVIVGYLIVRTKVKGRGLLDALCMLPLAVPGLVMAFGYVAMSLRWPFGKDGPLEGVASIFGRPQPVPVPDHGVLGPATALHRAFDGGGAGADLGRAGGGGGEPRRRPVHGGRAKVIVPLIMANLIAGGLLVFSFSMLEVSDSLLLAQQAKTSRSPRRSSRSPSAWATARTSPARWACGAWRC
jgi:iron(III) transport system permease protein